MNPAECISNTERCVQPATTCGPHRWPRVEKFTRWFIWSAAAILLATALGKISSVFGSARILEMQDPILGVKFRLLLPLVGGLEVVVALACLSWRPRSGIKLVMIGWLVTAFLIYRLGLWLVGWHHPCSCMGSLAGMLGLSDRTADTLIKVALAYLLVGSIGGWATHFLAKKACCPERALRGPRTHA